MGRVLFLRRSVRGMAWRYGFLAHALFDLLALIGVRDRLRCPACHAVGTWKPHGGLVDRIRGDRAPARWLCKWCGFFYGEDGVTRQAGVHIRDRCWTTDLDASYGFTPMTAVDRAYNPDGKYASEGGHVPNPWRG